MEQTKKLMNKDDKKKMGENNHNVYKKVKKMLMNKNAQSKKLAGILDEIISNKMVVQTEETKEKKKQQVERVKEDPVQQAVDKIRGTPADMKGLDEAARQKKYAEVVDLLRKRFTKVTADMQQKSQIEQANAVEKFKQAEDKMKAKIYGAMAKQVPQVIRTVLGKALMSFQDGKITRAEVNEILKKNFSDQTFDNILLCVQGNLEKCKKIKLETWRKNAEKHIGEKASIVKIRARKIKDKKRDAALKKIETIYRAQAKMTKKERAEQRKIERQGNLLAKEIVNNKDMSAADKMTSMVNLKKQVNDLIHELYGKSGHESSNEITAMVDFLSDSKGGSVRVAGKELKSFAELSVTPKDMELLKEKLSPEISGVLSSSLKVEDKPEEPPKAQKPAETKTETVPATEKPAENKTETVPTTEKPVENKTDTAESTGAKGLAQSDLSSED